MSKYNNKKIYHCDECDYHCYTIQKLEKHYKTKKHIQSLEKHKPHKCPLCEESFTEEAYLRHQERNKGLINLWNKRNHWTQTGYMSSGWQPFFKEFGGWNGENLPKCDTFKVYSSKLRCETFEDMLAKVRKTLQSEYKNKRPPKGLLSNPFLYLLKEDTARWEEPTESEEEEFNNNYDKIEQEKKKKKDKLKLQAHQEFCNFKFSELELENGYYLNFEKKDFRFTQPLYDFGDFIGLPRPNFNFGKLNEAFEDKGRDIIFLPNEDNERHGLFFIDYNGEKEDQLLAEWEGDELLILDYESDYSDSDSDTSESD